MKKIFLYFGTALALIIVLALYSALMGEATKPVEMIIGGMKGDYKYVPAEIECQEMMSAFIEESGFARCVLLESWEFDECDECSERGFQCSTIGCSVCKIKCET